MAQVVEEAKANDAIYATAEFIGYSLWVVPRADAGRELADAISECAARLQTPPFLPHMTLLGGIVVGVVGPCRSCMCAVCIGMSSNHLRRESKRRTPSPRRRKLRTRSMR
jgi:hypothetical protein